MASEQWISLRRNGDCPETRCHCEEARAERGATKQSRQFPRGHPVAAAPLLAMTTSPVERALRARSWRVHLKETEHARSACATSTTTASALAGVPPIIPSGARDPLLVNLLTRSTLFPKADPSVASLPRNDNQGGEKPRPYHPSTNGKAERFIQTLQREWPYAFPFPSSRLRTARLSRYLHF